MKWEIFTQQVEILLTHLWQQTTTSQTGLRQSIYRFYKERTIEQRIARQESFDYRKAFDHFQQKMGSNRIVPLYRRLGIALSILFLFSGGVIYYFIIDISKIHSSSIEVDIVKPGDAKAILELADGTIHWLDTTPRLIDNDNSFQIVTDSLGLNYSNLITREGYVYKEHTITVPRGGEYHIVLHDGSDVWLNSESKLIYPECFRKDRREVTLIGEAFFDIRAMSGIPFIVNTDRGKIEVVGTSFNLSSYRESNQLILTLVDGRINFHAKNAREVTLSPNQQLIVSGHNQFTIKEVDPQYAISWKYGRFKFEEARLEDILEQLARWYDINIFYTEEPIKNLRFSGDLSRYKTIDIFLDMLQRSSNIKLILNGNTLIVSR